MLFGTHITREQLPGKGAETAASHMASAHMPLRQDSGGGGTALTYAKGLSQTLCVNRQAQEPEEGSAPVSRPSV